MCFCAAPCASRCWRPRPPQLRAASPAGCPPCPAARACPAHADTRVSADRIVMRSSMLTHRGRQHGRDDEGRRLQARRVRRDNLQRALQQLGRLLRIARAHGDHDHALRRRRRQQLHRRARHSRQLGRLAQRGARLLDGLVQHRQVALAVRLPGVLVDVLQPALAAAVPASRRESARSGGRHAPVWQQRAHHRCRSVSSVTSASATAEESVGSTSRPFFSVA